MPTQRTMRLAVTAASVLVLSLSPALLFADSYSQVNLVSNGFVPAVTVDSNLINPWGMAFSPTSPFWISDQGMGVATVYNGLGAITPLVVTVPGGGPPSGPTGQVWNGTSSFALPTGGATNFIFDTLNGTIAARSSGSTAVTVATTTGAIYTGLALASVGSNNYLYAANTAGTGSIQVFDTNFNNVTGTTFAGKFSDTSLPAGYVPFNVQLINGDLYVTYADLGPMGAVVSGSTGYVIEYDTSGDLIGQFAGGGPLVAPWGLTLAPAGFGSFSNDLLVGNFGNGEIDAYSTTGTFEGVLDNNGAPIVNPNLWALDFRTGGAASTNPDALYFTAGVDNQVGGLFGEIIETPESPTLLFVGLGILALALLRLRSQWA